MQTSRLWQEIVQARHILRKLACPHHSLCIIVALRIQKAGTVPRSLAPNPDGHALDMVEADTLLPKLWAQLEVTS